MTSHVEPHDGRISADTGTVTVVSGMLFVAAVAFSFVLSLGDVLDPPTWVRAVGLVWLPIGLFGAPVAYALAHDRPGRNRALVGLLLMLVGLVAFVAPNVAVG